MAISGPATSQPRPGFAAQDGLTDERLEYCGIIHEMDYAGNSGFPLLVPEPLSKGACANNFSVARPQRDAATPATLSIPLGAAAGGMKSRAVTQKISPQWWVLTLGALLPLPLGVWTISTRPMRHRLLEQCPDNVLAQERLSLPPR